MQAHCLVGDRLTGECLSHNWRLYSISPIPRFTFNVLEPRLTNRASRKIDLMVNLLEPLKRIATYPCTFSLFHLTYAPFRRNIMRSTVLRSAACALEQLAEIVTMMIPYPYLIWSLRWLKSKSN